MASKPESNKTEYFARPDDRDDSTTEEVAGTRKYINFSRPYNTTSTKLSASTGCRPDSRATRSSMLDYPDASLEAGGDGSDEDIDACDQRASSSLKAPKVRLAVGYKETKAQIASDASGKQARGNRLGRWMLNQAGQPQDAFGEAVTTEEATADQRPLDGESTFMEVNRDGSMVFTNREKAEPKKWW